MTTPTPAQFVADHGDPTQWTATEHDTYDTLTRIAPPPDTETEEIE